MDAVLLDFRYAVRALVKRPGFALAAIVSLAVGIAANTAIFSVVNGIFLKDPAGVMRTERLVELTRDVNGRWFDMAYPVVQHLRHAPPVEDVAAFALVSASVVGDGEPAVYGGLAVTASYFDATGVRPAHGRAFAAFEATYPSVEPVALISDQLWEREFQRSKGVVGRILRVNGQPLQVVGILPAEFHGHHTGLLALDIYVPLGLPIPGLPSPADLDNPQSGAVETLARLVPGVAPEVAAAQLSAISSQFLAERLGASPPQAYTVRVEPWAPVPGVVRGPARAFLAVLSLLVALALTMACVNVTSMLLARISEQRRELAVRRAIGATGFRLGRQIVTEALVLFGAAGALGIAGSAWAVGLVTAFSPRLPVPGRVALDFGLDYRVLGFALVVTFGAGIVFSLFPAFHASRFGLVPALKEGGAATGSASRARLRAALVGVQIGFTTLLLVAAGLFGGALRDMRAFDPGWNAAGVQVLELDLELNATQREDGLAFHAVLLERVRALPGVESAALAAKLPLAGRSSFGQVTVPGTDPPPGQSGFVAYLNRVSSDYFRTLRLPLLRGRDFTAADDARAPRVAVVNETMARRLWPEGDALGRRFFIGSQERGTEVQVIGLVADAKYRSLDEETPNFYYLPAAQWYNPQMTLHVRAAAEAATVAATAVRGVVRELDPDLPVATPRPLTKALELFFLPQRLAASVAGLMGAFGLLLAAVGVYGVTAFVVAQRTREFGIRMALGATRTNVIRLVLGRGAIAPAVGVAFGIGVGFVFSRVASHVVPGVTPGDPVALGAVPAGVIAVTLVAVLVPLWRVLRRDPLVALRVE